MPKKQGYKKRAVTIASKKLDGNILLAEALAEYFADPLGFVYFAFPWGQEGTILADFDGPDAWQTRVLRDLGEKVITTTEAIQVAVKSGHGPGKTALIAWIILWFMSTRVNPQIVVTANTKPQLETKTWRELAKWHQLFIHPDLYTWTQTKFASNLRPETWAAYATPWNKDKSEAFAGTHDQNVLMIFDEASNIPDIIWEVAGGAMTTPGSMWIAFGNPTRNEGMFRECFRKFGHRWMQYTVDTRFCKMADQRYITKLLEDYDEDSDYIRVRVRGEFPRASVSQLIPGDIVESAMNRNMHEADYVYAPKILGVDVARFGDDRTVLFKRQGYRAFDIQEYRNIDTMATAGIVASVMEHWKPDVCFVDGVGLGAGVVDRLRQLGWSVIDVNGANSPSDKSHFVNLRAEMWWKMRDWLMAGGIVPNSNSLMSEFTNLTYWFSSGNNKVQIESKDDIKGRGFDSPDIADALALTFAHPVMARGQDERDRMYSRNDHGKDEGSYDIFGGGV